jgi:DNA ligase-1
MAKREFLQRAHVYNPRKHGIGGLWYSKKLDGMRGFWDGGVSRGIPKSDVPWANIDKDYRYKKIQIATGLWSRYGHVVHAPDWWLDAMPKCPLDGELWNKLLSRQQIMSIVKKHNPDEGWKMIHLHVYDIPPLTTIFSSGIINNTNYKKTFNLDNIYGWIQEQEKKRGFYYSVNPLSTTTFRTNYSQICKLGEHWKIGMVPHKQYELPFQTSLAKKHIDNQLMNLLPTQDGLVVRHPDKIWVPEQSHYVLKVKDFDDDEATVVGYVTGRETDKGSRLLGMMGAMVVRWKGKIFEISGFTDDERRLIGIGQGVDPYTDAREWAISHPEETCPNDIEADSFPKGSIVTFKYQGLSDDGIPNSANYWRQK